MFCVIGFDAACRTSIRGSRLLIQSEDREGQLTTLCTRPELDRKTRFSKGRSSRPPTTTHQPFGWKREGTCERQAGRQAGKAMTGCRSAGFLCNPRYSEIICSCPAQAAGAFNHPSLFALVSCPCYRSFKNFLEPL
jgi:hypothetical protein